jgi:hypothetical protein
MHRELAREKLIPALFRRLRGAAEARTDEIPCIFPASREFGIFRDEFAADSPLQRRVCKLSVPLAKCVNQYRTVTRCPGADERHVGAQPVRTNLSTLRSWVNPA